MGVFDGQAVSAAVTNPAFLDANADDTALGIIGLANVAPASGAALTNIQQAFNTLFTTTGATQTVAGTVYSAPASTISDGTSHQTALTALANKFHPTTGHAHTGAAGDGPMISATSISGTKLHGFFVQGADISVTGLTFDATSQLTGQTPSSTTTVEGVVVNSPHNRVFLRYATGTDVGDEIIDAFGNEVYARVTESAGTWTLTFYVDISGSDTPYSFSSLTDVRWFYQKLFNPLSNAPVYSELAFIPSENTTVDVLPATTTIQGKVSLAAVAPGVIAATGSAGTANASVANANHTHEGVHGINTDGSTNILGDVQFTGAGGTLVSQLGQIVTITSTALASTTPAAVASAGAVGVGTTAARADHVHEGVHSVKASGFAQILGDATFLAGSGISLAQAGNTISISATGGGGGGGAIITTQGNADVMLRPDQTTWYLQSPDLTFWVITVTTLGELVATSGASGPANDLKIQRTDLTEVSFAITNLGELQVENPAAGGTTLTDHLFLWDSSGIAWKVGVTNLDEIYTENDTTAANYFRVTSDTGQVLFQVQEVNGGATQYQYVFTAATLPATPASISGTLPWAFYDTGSVKRPIFWDGANWRYFSDNSVV